MFATTTLRHGNLAIIVGPGIAWAVETHFKKPKFLGFLKKTKKPKKLGF